MTIDGDKWKSKKAIFSNDLLELKQVKLAINSLEVFPIDEKLRFKSSLNYLILDEKVSIPFWFGSRDFSFNQLQSTNRWNFGYENLDKDGYFIGRKFNSIDLSDNFVDNPLTKEPDGTTDINAEVKAICDTVWSTTVKDAWKVKLIADKVGIGTT